VAALIDQSLNLSTVYTGGINIQQQLE